MYLLQIVLNVHYGTTGMVDRHVENYEAETLKPLLVKANNRLLYFYCNGLKCEVQND